MWPHYAWLMIVQLIILRSIVDCAERKEDNFEANQCKNDGSVCNRSLLGSYLQVHTVNVGKRGDVVTTNLSRKDNTTQSETQLNLSVSNRFFLKSKHMDHQKTRI